MTTKIRDLVSVNTQAALVKGVQLSWYGDPRREAENERLATGYIFSSGRTRKPYASAVSIFESICASLNGSDSPNVFTVIAQYGHGKSHFALVLANYFGRRADDPIVRQIIERVESCSDADKAEGFRSFKEVTEKPQLVVRLSGHDFIDLRQGFLQALRRALDENEASRGYAIKSVSAEAAAWLRGLSKEQRKRADDFLDERYGMDIDALIVSLEQFDTTKESVARELSKAIVGLEVNFGTALNLREVIDHIIAELCTGPEAPYHKMVILFDELGVYAQGWCHNRMEAGGLAPQQITEACDNNRGHLCLIGLVQRQIVEFVKGSALEEDFMKWAGRFPLETTYTLEANLEQVIKGLLQKNPSKWKTFARENLREITDEAEMAWDVLKNYQSSDQWNKEKFTSTVGVGTYPLHPLTTGLLCHLKFTQGSRTIIDVVNTTVQSLQDKPAVEQGRLLWLRPTILVETFEGSFEGKEERYSLYANAVRHLGNNAPPLLYDVLKALFLYDVGNIGRPDNQTHASVIAGICGLPLGQVVGALEQLDKEFSVIRFSQAAKEYQFSGIGTSRNEIRQQVLREIAGASLPGLASSLASLNLLERLQLPEAEAIEFKADFGLEGDEWHLSQHLLDASRLSVENVKSVINQVRDSRQAMGAVLYLISEDGVELDEAHAHAESVLDAFQAAGAALPLAIAVPQTPAVGVRQEILLKKAIEAWGQAKREQYGEAYGEVLSDSERRLEDALRAHLKEGGVKYFIPTAVARHLRASDAHRIERIADKLFEQAFPYRAPAKSAVMKQSSAQGSTAVAEVSRHLLTNSVDFGKLSQMTQNLTRAVLFEGQDRWGVLTSRYRLQEPSNERVLKAWKELDAAVSSDNTVRFSSLIDKLRNTPYGYDDYALTLLITSWIGKNKNELSFTGSIETRRQNIRPLSLTELQGQLKKAREFIKWLIEGNVQVRNVGRGKKQRAHELLTRLESVSDYEEARKLLASSAEVLAGISAEDELRQEIVNTATSLKEHVTKVHEYRQAVIFQHRLADGSKDVLQLLRLARTLPSRPETYLAYDDEFEKVARRFIDDKVETIVAKHAGQRLERVEGYEKLRDEFAARRDALREAGREDLEQKYSDALARLDEEHRRLGAEHTEAVIVAQVAGMQTEGVGLLRCRESAEAVGSLLNNDLAAASDRSRRAAEAKLLAIQASITSYERWLADLPSRLGVIEDTRSAQTLLYEIIGKESEFENTPEFKLLQEHRRDVEARLNILSEEEFEKQRRALNKRVTEELAKRAERARTLQDIKAILGEIEETAAQLQPPAENDLLELEAARQKLLDKVKQISRWVNEDLPARLSVTWEENAVRTLRTEVSQYEQVCAGAETLPVAVANALTELEGRLELLRKLADSERRTTTLQQAEESLAEVTTLKASRPGGVSVVEEAAVRIRAKIEVLREQEREKVRQWLVQFETSLSGEPSPQLAAELLRKLEEPPSALADDDRAYISEVREKLSLVRDRDIANRITDDFTKLATPEQRAECLLRIAEICKREGLPDGYVERLVTLLGLGSIA